MGDDFYRKLQYADGLDELADEFEYALNSLVLQDSFIGRTCESPSKHLSATMFICCLVALRI